MLIVNEFDDPQFFFINCFVNCFNKMHQPWRVETSMPPFTTPTLWQPPLMNNKLFVPHCLWFHQTPQTINNEHSLISIQIHPILVYQLCTFPSWYTHIGHHGFDCNNSSKSIFTNRNFRRWTSCEGYIQLYQQPISEHPRWANGYYQGKNEGPYRAMRKIVK